MDYLISKRFFATPGVGQDEGGDTFGFDALKTLDDIKNGIIKFYDDPGLIGQTFGVITDDPAGSADCVLRRLQGEEVCYVQYSGCVSNCDPTTGTIKCPPGSIWTGKYYNGKSVV